MMEFVFVVLVAFLSIFDAFPTAQYPDKIIYDGKEYDLFSNPLEYYFEENPDKRPYDGITSTALWRGYVATFNVKSGQLYLEDIEIEIKDTTSVKSYDTKWISVLNEVFPEQSVIKIDWFTGLLVIPHVELVNYVHMGYSSSYEKYILLEVNEGNLTSEIRFEYQDYEKFKEKQFQAFMRTEEYKKIKTELRKDGNSDEFIDSFLRSFIIEYTSKILNK